jgi:two-component system NtrC family sensor kinase
MPDMGGEILWRHICERHPALRGRLLFVTGDTLSPDAREFLKEARCTGLDKPFSKADLLARVAALVA